MNFVFMNYMTVLNTQITKMNCLTNPTSELKTVVRSSANQYRLSHLFLLHILEVLMGLYLSLVSAFACIRSALFDLIIHSHAEPPVFDT